LNLFLQLLHFAMLFKKLVEQHRVHRVVAHGVNLSLCVAHDQVWVDLRDVLCHETKLLSSIWINLFLIMERGRFQREDRLAGPVHRFDVVLEPLRRKSSFLFEKFFPSHSLSHALFLASPTFSLSSALPPSAASFHRLLFDRQAFRLAFTFFSHLSPPWFYFCCLLNAFISASHQARSGIRFPRSLQGWRSRCYRNRQAEEAIPLAVHELGLDELVQELFDLFHVQLFVAVHGKLRAQLIGCRPSVACKIYLPFDTIERIVGRLQACATVFHTQETGTAAVA